MREITFLERLAGDLVEGGFARVLKPRLQPVQIAKALAKEMGANRMVGPDGPMVANHYSVFLHPDDLSNLAGFQGNLERELSGYLSGYAARRGLKPVGAVSVSLKEATDIKPGHVRTDSAMMDTPEPAASAAPSTTQPIESTMEMRVVAAAAPAPAPAPASPEQPPALLIGPAGEGIPLARPSTTVGRAIDNDVVLEVRSVSRYHARILWETDRYLLEDLDSTNGSFASGQRVRRHALLDGEEISFGGVRFTFRLASR